jgi:tol-pal system protein YbgF
MFKKLVIISAAVLGSTFAVGSLQAEPQVVESQPDRAANSPSRGLSPTGPDPAFVENLMLQVRDLQQQLAEQRGLVEELNYQIQRMQQEQKERYVDLDQRILSLQQQLDTEVSAPAASGNNSSQGVSEGAVSDEVALTEYNAARELIRTRDFPGAISALQAFTRDHPGNELTPNAWDWLGEVHLVSREVSQAQTAFETVVEDFPDNAKVPDSLYKLCVISQQQNQAQQATAFFQRVIGEFPGSQSAKLAQARLNSN